MLPIVIGPPAHGGVRALTQVAMATDGAVTLAWLTGPDLTAAVPDVLAAGGTVLAADQPGAFAHQLAVHGAPQAVVVCAEAGVEDEVRAVVSRAVAELPPSAVLVVGPASIQTEVAAALRERELAEPLEVEPAELGPIVQELARSARWERV